MEFEKPLDNSSSTPLSAVSRNLADGRYVLVRHVAEGGTAHVHLGYDTWTETWRAVKTLLPEFARRPALMHRFEREAATMKGLSHDNIIAVYDAGIEGETVFMVMEYAEGGSVIDWIERNGPMPPRMATSVVLELCAGIDAAHRQGVIHRDIKPQNLLVDRTGTCKVTDFGIAQVLEQTRMTMTGTVMGTMGYMAPEQNESAKHADERADVYSIAATFYTLIKGEAATHLFMAEEQDFDGIPESLSTIIRKGSQYRRESRFQTVREMMGELEGALRLLAPDPLDTPPLVPYDLPSLEEMTPPSVDASVGSGLGSQAGLLPVLREPTEEQPAERSFADEPVGDPLSVPSYIDQEWMEEAQPDLYRAEIQVSDEPHSLDRATEDFDDDLERVELPDVRRSPPPVIRQHRGRAQVIRQGVTISLGTVVTLGVLVLGLVGMLSGNKISRKQRDVSHYHDILLKNSLHNGLGQLVPALDALRDKGLEPEPADKLRAVLAELRTLPPCHVELALIRRAYDLAYGAKNNVYDNCVQLTGKVTNSGHCKDIREWAQGVNRALEQVDDQMHQHEQMEQELGGRIAETIGLVGRVNYCGRPTR